eukprot:TRINITY_DN10075_c0_g1_i1.p1 TRINITY_DN10075_c0_g1~~TRINITY_DN10075_c0_g1_i1.p1  ORF type:complete len:212 (-),score=36.79 TRINITY_DN10075_c0_g1_i1:20-655(-)
MVVIGIAGGSGSGKTTIAEAILERVGIDNLSYLHYDSYYKELTHLTPEQREAVNFDHPDSLDTALLIQHLEELKAGYAIESPTYDFTTHSRNVKTNRILSHSVIIVEGILVLSDPDLRKFFDIMIYVDTDTDIRLIRRLQRDIKERKRTFDSVVNQYLTNVRPMHLEFVEPSKKYAHIIIPEGGNNTVGIEMVSCRILDVIAKAALDKNKL